MTLAATDNPLRRLRRSHLKLGWVLIFTFATLGICLESLHGFKSAWYLEQPQRRALMMQAHIYGVVLGIIHVLFAATISQVKDSRWRLRSFAGTCLKSGSMLVPTGFLFGGTYLSASQPGIGIILIAPGLLLLAVGVALTAFIARS